MNEGPTNVFPLLVAVGPDSVEELNENAGVGSFSMVVAVVEDPNDDVGADPVDEFDFKEKVDADAPGVVDPTAAVVEEPPLNEKEGGFISVLSKPVFLLFFDSLSFELVSLTPNFVEAD